MKTYKAIASLDPEEQLITDSLTADQLTALSYEAVLIIADTTQENGLYSVWYKGQWRTMKPDLFINYLAEVENHGN